MTYDPARYATPAERITDRIDELTRPITTRETQVVYHGGQHLTRRTHVQQHDPLLTQLDAAVTPSAGTLSGARGYESRPSARIDALDVLALIDHETVRWVKTVTREDPRPDTTGNLRILAAAVGSLGPGLLKDLDHDVLRWWAAARVTTGWDSPAWAPHVACPVCEKVGGLRIRVAPMAGWCRECQAAWDDATIGLLGEHVRLMTGDTPDTPTADVVAESA